MHKLRLLALFAMLLLTINIWAASANNLRNLRYCEVIVGHGLTADVYNSANFSNCPQNLWDKISVAQLKKQNKSSFIYLNGPRYFILDGADVSNLSNDVRTFGNIKMRKGGVVKISVSDLLKGFRAYKLHNVYRSTVWTYDAGKPVFELVSPAKQVYVMQSYSNEIIKQSEQSLPNLGGKLKLPPGWTYKTGILKRAGKVTAKNNKAVVVQDDFKNTYQLADHDLLL